jgi:hypothetical protein
MILDPGRLGSIRKVYHGKRSMKHLISAIVISTTSAYPAVAGAQYGADFLIQQRMLQQQQQMQQQMSQQQMEQHQMQEQMAQQKALQHKMEQQMQQQSLDRMNQQQRRDNMR